jgi:hypothetical protein
MNCQVRARLMLHAKLLRCRRTGSRSAESASVEAGRRAPESFPRQTILLARASCIENRTAPGSVEIQGRSQSRGFAARPRGARYARAAGTCPRHPPGETHRRSSAACYHGLDFRSRPSRLTAGRSGTARRGILVGHAERTCLVRPPGKAGSGAPPRHDSRSLRLVTAAGVVCDAAASCRPIV